MVRMISLLIVAILSQLSATAVVAQAPRQTRIEIEDKLQRKEIQVGDLTRRYLIYVPESNDKPAPVVFGFHGHGGNAINVARTFRFQKHWPDTIVVYMQGIPTPGRLTDPEGKRNGWQHGASAQDDRDLKFFDAVLKEVKEKHQVDENRIYSTGHSNGGGFTYLLWHQRGDQFAAMAPSAAASRIVAELKPKPVMHLAGEKDKLVKYQWQQRTMEFLRKLNQCEEMGEEWASLATKYPSKIDCPVVTYIHSGGHKYPTEGPELIVKFFKEHSRESSQLVDRAD